MTEHDAIRNLLPMAAAGGLTADEQRRMDSHLADCEGCAAEMAEWRLITEAMEEVPAPAVPELLLQRTRNRVIAREAARREGRLSDIILGFVMLFGWTISLTAWLLWRLMTAGSVLGVSLTSIGFWLGGSTLLAWLTAGVAVVALAPKWKAMRERS